MSAGEPFRPRRAWQQPATEDSTASDDTPAQTGRRARRGEEPAAGPESRPTDPPQARRPARVAVAGLGDEPPEPAVNPFARPGTQSAKAPAPDARPAVHADDASATPIPAPVMPRSAGEFAESPGPAPRRSALSSTTPLTPEGDDSPAPEHWLRAHRATLTKWAAAGLIVALVVAVLAFLIVRTVRQSAGEQPSASPSPSSTATSAAPADVDVLLTPADLATVASSAWTITATSQSLGDHSGRVACFQTAPQEPNPTTTLQRTLATTDETAALHRVDVFADADVAAEVFESRVSVLSSCSEVPSYIVNAQSVSGLAEDTFQITVEFQDDPSQFHTVLITRAGAAVQMLDVTKFGSAVDAETPAEAITRSQGVLSEAQGADAPSDVRVSGTVIPAVEPLGWLSPSDLPRIRAGAGRWSMTGPGDLTSTGTGCENLTLATEAGPATRSQATYLMTQDDEAPTTFGIDEMQFYFEKSDTAKDFADKLVRGLTSCADRVNTATVKRLDDVKTTVGDATGTSRLFDVSQATSATESVEYQLLVTRVDDLVSYTLVSVSEDYRMTTDQLNALAARVAVRATQADS